MPTKRAHPDKKRLITTDDGADAADTTLRMSVWRPGVLVTGGRDFTPSNAHGTWFKYWLRAVQPAFLLTGAASGVDLWAQAIAQAQGVDLHRCPVTPKEWSTHGGAAGPMRNTVMLEAMLEHGGGYCIVFDGGHGTADMLHKAEKRLRVINMQKSCYTAPERQTQLLLG